MAMRGRGTFFPETPMRRLAALVMMLVGMTAFAQDDPVKKELDALGGTYAVVGGETCNEKGDAKIHPDVLKDLRFSLRGNAFTFRAEKDAVESKGTFKVDPSKKPKTLDAQIESGPEKGRSQLAIYKTEGKQLTICFGEPGKDRPSEFTTKNKPGTT